MTYNTEPFHGKMCRVEKNDVAMEFSEGWNFNVLLDMAARNRAGQHWKEGLPGQAGWSGSFGVQLVLGNTEQKAFLDNLITATPGTKLTDVKFLLDSSTNAYVGNLFIIGFSVDSNVDDVVKGTVTFQGDGALSSTDSA